MKDYRKIICEDCRKTDEAPYGINRCSECVMNDTPPALISSLMVGNCPKCESKKTTDCENEMGINDICVGKCVQCGYLWCLECGKKYEGKCCSCMGCCPHEEKGK